MSKAPQKNSLLPKLDLISTGSIECSNDILHISILVTPKVKCIPAAFSLSFTLLGASLAQAQIAPDNTLGVDRSTIINSTIQGGAQRGTNLFHSFTEFSIGNGQRVDFVNPIGVNNIITRVTDAPSNINGTLGVLGNANLFFLNPNGIFFGQNARLDLTGTFVGSTANGLKFADGNVYSTVNPQVPLLTMTTPVGLQFGSKSGDITVTDATNLLTNYDGGDIQITARNLQILDVAYPLLPSIWDFLKLLALLPFQPVCKTQGILTSKLPNFSSKMGQLLPQVQSAAWVVRSRSQA